MSDYKRPLTYAKSHKGAITELDLEGASLRWCPTSDSFEVRVPYGKPGNEKYLLVDLEAEDLNWIVSKAGIRININGTVIELPRHDD